jgi:hypothetical protein
MANDPTRNDQSKSPADKTGEDQGKIKKPQLTDHNMPEDDLARGSEPAAGGQGR